MGAFGVLNVDVILVRLELKRIESLLVATHCVPQITRDKYDSCFNSRPHRQNNDRILSSLLRQVDRWRPDGVDLLRGCSWLHRGFRVSVCRPPVCGLCLLPRLGHHPWAQYTNRTYVLSAWLIKRIKCGWLRVRLSQSRALHLGACPDRTPMELFHSNRQEDRIGRSSPFCR